MKQLNLNITRKYIKVCGFYSRFVNVEGLINGFKAILALNKDILLMDVVLSIYLMFGECYYLRSGVLLWEVKSKWIYLTPLSCNLMEPHLSYIGSLYTRLMW